MQTRFVEYLSLTINEDINFLHQDGSILPGKDAENTDRKGTSVSKDNNCRRTDGESRYLRVSILII